MMENKDKPIKYVDYGTANNFDDRIELNKKLKFYPKLHDELLKHELEHEEGKFNLKDLKHDSRPIKNIIDYYKFLITTPKAWTQFSPINKSTEWYIDYSALFLWFVIFLLLTCFIWVWFKW